MNFSSIKAVFHHNVCFLLLVLVFILFSFPRFTVNADPGDSFINAIEIELGYAMGNFSGHGEKIYYRLTVNYPEQDPYGYDYYETWLYLTPLAGSANFDPDIYLYSPASNFLRSSTSSGYVVEEIIWREEGFRDFIHRDTVVTYFIEVRCYAGSGDFSLEVQFDFGQWGDSPENAYLIGYTNYMDTTFELGNTTGNLPGPGVADEMWYVIPLMVEDYNFTLTGPEDTDFNLDLYDNTLTHIGSATGDSYPDKLSAWNLDPGEYGIKISSVQGSGTYILNIAKADITPPDVKISNPSNGMFTKDDITLSYTVSDGSTTIYLDNIANTSALPSESVLLDLAEGSHNITIVAEDIAGNVGTATSLFTVDITSPIVNLLNPSNGMLTKDDVTLSYTVSDGSTTIYLDNIANISALPSESVLLDLAEGSHNITIVAEDIAGNIGTATILFTVDTIAPLIIIDSPTSNFYSTNIISIALSGEADNYWYYIEGVDVDNQTWPFVLERGLSDGTYTLYAYGNDTAGNINHVSITFTVDTTITTTIPVTTPTATTTTPTITDTSSPVPPTTTTSTKTSTTTTTTVPSPTSGWSILILLLSTITLICKRKFRS